VQATVETIPRISASSASPKLAARNVAVDAYRGFVMLLMMAEVLEFATVARAFPGNWFWSFLAYNQTHVDWAGCSLHDLIQPSFSFLVGTALPYSIASRMARGGSFRAMLPRALWRSFLLIALGIFLRSLHSQQTNFTFEDTLTQIGLGYPFLFLLGFRSTRACWIAFTSILAGYWLAWALYPIVSPPGDFAGNFAGFMAHWNKNANLGAAFDLWFLNLFPRPTPFVANSGGYLTLSFIPTLATMILGLISGKWFRQEALRLDVNENGSPRVPFAKFLIAGAVGIAAGLLLHALGICPIVKRIWTPAWTLFSGGACFLLLALFCWVVDVMRQARLVFPLVVIGMNSIAAYMIAHLFQRFIEDSLHTNLGHGPFRVMGDGLEPLLTGFAVLGAYWLILFWMFRRKLFLRL
jgi:heparan-alpha-glucosaminide N-acetyltransferase